LGSKGGEETVWKGSVPKVGMIIGRGGVMTWGLKVLFSGGRKLKMMPRNFSRAERGNHLKEGGTCRRKEGGSKKRPDGLKRGRLESGVRV